MNLGTTTRAGLRTVAAGFLLYGALFTDRLAPLFLADRIGAAFEVDASALGLLPFAIALGWLLGLAAGRLVGRRISLQQRLWVGALVTATAGMASLLAPNFALFLLLRLLGGIGANITSPALIALVVRASPPHRRGIALGTVMSSTRIAGSFAAPIALTAIVAQAGWQPALAVATGTLLLAIGPVVLLVPRHVGSAEAPAKSLPPVYREEGPRILAIAGVLAMLTFLWLTLISQGSVPMLESWLGVDVTTAGRLLGWFGIGSTVAAIGVPLWSDRSRAAAVGGSCLVAAVAGGYLGIAVLLDWQPATVVVGLCFALAGIGLGGLPLAISVLPADAVREGDVDRAIEVPIISAELVGGAILPAVAFAIVAQVGIAPVLLVVAAGFLALAAVGAPALSRNVS